MQGAVRKERSIVTGGSDRIISIFEQGKPEADWLNLFGMGMMVLIFIPNIIYGMKCKDVENRCRNRAMNGMEQIGRYASMFFMIFHIGLAESGFSSVAAFMVYIVGNMILIAAYWIVWIRFFLKRSFGKSMALAVIPTGVFLLSGITAGNLLLIGSAVIFGMGHSYVTWQNARVQKSE